MFYLRSTVACLHRGLASKWGTTSAWNCWYINVSGGIEAHKAYYQTKTTFSRDLIIFFISEEASFRPFTWNLHWTSFRTSKTPTLHLSNTHETLRNMCPCQVPLCLSSKHNYLSGHSCFAGNLCGLPPNNGPCLSEIKDALSSPKKNTLTQACVNYLSDIQSSCSLGKGSSSFAECENICGRS